MSCVGHLEGAQVRAVDGSEQEAVHAGTGDRRRVGREGGPVGRGVRLAARARQWALRLTDDDGRGAARLVRVEEGRPVGGRIDGGHVEGCSRREDVGRGRRGGRGHVARAGAADHQHRSVWTRLQGHDGRARGGVAAAVPHGMVAEAEAERRDRSRRTDATPVAATRRRPSPTAAGDMCPAGATIAAEPRAGLSIGRSSSRLYAPLAKGLPAGLAASDWRPAEGVAGEPVGSPRPSTTTTPRQRGSTTMDDGDGRERVQVGLRRAGSSVGPTPSSIRTEEQERRRHQGQEDGAHPALTGQQEGEPDEGAGGQRQLGGVADEEVPPEVAEGADGPGHGAHGRRLLGAPGRRRRAAACA